MKLCKKKGTEDIAAIVIEKLILGVDRKRITEIENVLKSTILKLKNPTDKESILIKFFKDNNLETDSINDIFGRAERTHAGDEGALRNEQNELKDSFESDYVLFVNSGNNSYKDITEERKRLIEELSSKGSLNLLLDQSSSRFKNKINSIYLSESLNQINFKSSQEANAAQIYLQKTDSTELDNTPEIKKQLQDLLNQGFTKDQIVTALSLKEGNIRTDESYNTTNDNFTRNLKDVSNSNGTDKKHQKTLDDWFENKYGGETFVELLTGERGAEVIGDLNQFVKKQTLPLGYENALKNLSENTGQYNASISTALLELFKVHKTGSNLQTGFEQDLLIHRLDTETYATLDFASDLTITGSSARALEYIATARAFRDDDSYKRSMSKIFGTEKDVKGRVISKSYVKFLDEIDPEISQNREANDIFYEYALHGARNNVPREEIQKKIGELYNRMYKETDGLVRDFLTEKNDKSRHALKKVFTNTDSYNAFINKVQSYLSPMGIGFSASYEPLSEAEKLMVSGSAGFYGGAGIQEEGRGKRIEFKRNAFLLPAQGTNFETIYIAYEDTPSGPVMIELTDENGNREPLAFSSKEQYLLDIEANADSKRKKMSRFHKKRAAITRVKLDKENLFRTKDREKTSALLRGDFNFEDDE